MSADDDIEVRESAAASDSNHFDSDTDLDEEDEVMEEEEEVRKPSEKEIPGKNIPWFERGIEPLARSLV